MANETLSIQKDDARLTVIGKSKADTYIDSGLGLDLGDWPSLDLDPFDLNWQIDVPGQDNLPDEIRIISPPYKTEYKNNEKIDLDGIIVKAYKNGSVWEDENQRYVDGLIPISELFFSPMIFKGGTSSDLVEVTIDGNTYQAAKAGSYTWSYLSKDVQNPSGPWRRTEITSVFNALNEAIIFAGPPSSSSQYAGINTSGIFYAYEKTNSTDVAGNYTRDLTTHDGRTIHNEYTIKKSLNGTGTYTKNNKTVVRNGKYTEYGVEQNYIRDYELLYSTSDIPTIASNDMEILWELVFNSHPVTPNITILWQRPVDGNVLSAEFHVEPYVGD